MGAKNLCQKTTSDSTTLEGRCNHQSRNARTFVGALDTDATDQLPPQAGNEEGLGGSTLVRDGYS